MIARSVGRKYKSFIWYDIYILILSKKCLFSSLKILTEIFHCGNLSVTIMNSTKKSFELDAYLLLNVIQFCRWTIDPIIIIDYKCVTETNGEYSGSSRSKMFRSSNQSMFDFRTAHVLKKIRPLVPIN